MVGKMDGFATLQIFQRGTIQHRSTLTFLVLIWIVLNPKIALGGDEISLQARNAEQVYESCLVCHSTREMQRGPILDALPSWYVIQQLNKFDKGIRGSNEENKSEFLMRPVVKQFADPVIWKEVAELIESQAKPEHLKIIRGNPERGKVLFAVCASCHGASGQGNKDLKAPPINVQEDWYLMDQLRKFQLGMRGYDPRDTEGQLMRNIVRSYSVNDLKDIVAFIARVGESSKK